MLTETSGTLGGGRVSMWSDIPNRCHRQPVDLAHLGEHHERSRWLVRWLESLAVDPLGSIRVALDLCILREELAADSPALVKQLLHLAEDERVAFDGGRVVRLINPDIVPDVPSLAWQGQPAEPLPQLIHSRIETGVQR
jgi:hypothetical protein